ncbi:cell division protein FtsA [Gottfriedia luciferensis]|uniref:cell division protein FtsA n=1 Tax=Gottfriedia luciferensis TaxID=178774 RepID=UPI000B43F266|nr:cell division protein FtsA [Gottfriedia luciferensis]
MNSNEIYVSLDVGTSTIKVIIGELVNDTLNIIGVGNVKSSGLKRGSIVDIDETVKSIKKAIDQAERMVGIHIDKVIVGVSANQVQLISTNGVVAVSKENKEIDNEDVLRVMDQAQVISIPPEREIIDVVPHEYIVDGLSEVKDPRGMIGVRLEMEGTLITGSRTLVHNILRCVERAGLEVTDICLQPMAASTIALKQDEKNLGVALVDIGGGSTTISVFREGVLIATSVLPVGGEHITKDISIGLKTSTEDAEKIKVKFGHAYYDTALTEEVLSVPIMGSEQHHQYSQQEISDIIEARLEEIFLMVQNELGRMRGSNLPGGFVLTGGTVTMTGVIELAQKVFKNNVRIATPDYIGVREPQYITGVGLIKYAFYKSKMRGKKLSSNIAFESNERKPVAVTNSNTKPKQQDEERVMSKVKSIFKYLWD